MIEMRTKQNPTETKMTSSRVDDEEEEEENRLS